MTKLRYQILAVIIATFTVGGFVVAQTDSGIGTLNPWKVNVSGNIAPALSTRGLQLGVRTTAPTAANGVTYYDSALGKFRCYQAGAWADCIGAGGGTPGGLDTQVQFNDGGAAFGGDAGLTYNKTTNTLTTDQVNSYFFSNQPNNDTILQNTTEGYNLNISTTDVATVGGAGDISITTGRGGTVSGSAGALTISTGAGGFGGDGDGGNLSIYTGNGTGDGSGGRFYMAAGNGSGFGLGGDIQFIAGGGGGGSGAYGGAVSFTAGNAGGGNSDGGDVLFQAGTGTGSGVNGKVKLRLGGGFYAVLDPVNIAASDKTFTFPNVSGAVTVLGATNPANDLTITGDVILTGGNRNIYTPDAALPGTLNLYAGNATAGSSNQGGIVNFNGGNGDTGADGGGFNLAGGDGGSGGSGGAFTLYGGRGNGTGDGGAATLSGGTANGSGNGGDITIRGGSVGGAGTRGNVLLQGAAYKLMNLTTSKNALFDFSNIATTDKTFTFPNASGTVAVSATSPVTLSAAGDIGCATCLTGNQTITLSGDVSGSGATAITTTIGSDKVLESMLKVVDTPLDEECLSYEATGGDFEWQSCGGIPTQITVADTADTTTFVGLFDDATGDLAPKTDAGLTYNATTATLATTTFSGALSGNATTATALAANGANCAASTAPLGVDASGAVESCTDFEEELNNSAGLLAALSDETGSGVAVFGTSPTFTTSITVDATDPADAGVIRLNNAGNIAWEASPAGTDLTLGVDANEILQYSGTLNATTLTESTNAVPNVTDNLSVFAATTSAQLAGVLSDETGSGVVAYATSPVFTTSITVDSTDPADAGAVRLNNAQNIAWEASPAGTDMTLGVDASEILQFSGTFNATTLTESANAVPNVTDNLSVFAATTSAQLAGVISNETGSGLLVFDTAPTFTTSIKTPFVLTGAADPADAGVLRSGNAESLCWEASPAGTDVCMSVDASELFTMTNGLTVTGTVAATTVTGANVTSGANPGHTHTTTSISGLDVSDDLNLTAGRSLTLTGDDVAADPETYTDTKCLYWESPVATDDFKSIWFAKQAATITSIWCESDQTVTSMFQVDDGTPADVDSVDLTCDSTPPEDTALNGDATLASGDRMDIDVASVSGTPTWVSMCFTFTYDD